MKFFDIANIFINCLIALGTIAVAILAIWGDWVKAKIYGPKLSLVLKNPEGSILSSAAKECGDVILNQEITPQNQMILAQKITKSVFA